MVLGRTEHREGVPRISGRGENGRACQRSGGPSAREKEVVACDQELNDKGVLAMASPLKRVREAVTIRVRDGRRPPMAPSPRLRKARRLHVDRRARPPTRRSLSPNVRPWQGSARSRCVRRGIPAGLKARLRKARATRWARSIACTGARWRYSLRSPADCRAPLRGFASSAGAPGKQISRLLPERERLRAGARTNLVGARDLPQRLQHRARRYAGSRSERLRGVH